MQRRRFFSPPAPTSTQTTRALPAARTLRRTGRAPPGVAASAFRICCAPGRGDRPRKEVDYGLAHQMVAFSAVAADESQAPGGETSLVSAQVSQADARNEPCRGNAGRRCEELAPVHLEPRPAAGSTSQSSWKTSR